MLDDKIGSTFIVGRRDESRGRPSYTTRPNFDEEKSLHKSHNRSDAAGVGSRLNTLLRIVE